MPDDAIAQLHEEGPVVLVATLDPEAQPVCARGLRRLEVEGGRDATRGTVVRDDHGADGRLAQSPLDAIHIAGEAHRRELEAIVVPILGDDVEDLACARPLEKFGGTPRHSDGRPETSGKPLDRVGVDGVEERVLVGAYKHHDRW
jgi:hypothetical protein